MARINVAVLRGGPSAEYEPSLKTGGAVLEYLPDDKYALHDILIDKTGQWHKNGIQVNESTVLQNTDIVFNALHGEYGEDGGVQRTLEKYGVPYTGSNATCSHICFDKARTHDALKNIPGIKMPEYARIKKSDVKDGDYTRVANDIFNAFGPPYIVKPLRGGSSIGVTISSTVQQLPQVLHDTLNEFNSVIVQQYVEGKEATCGIIENFRGEDYYALPPVEIAKTNNEKHFSYEKKYESDDHHMCPANLSEIEKRIIEEVSKRAHKTLGARHYSRSDFIVAPHGVYFLETNTLPALTKTSLLPTSLETIGSDTAEFLEHIIQEILKKKKRV
jgi:D-alanine-D-alanine ligase